MAHSHSCDHDTSSAVHEHVETACCNAPSPLTTSLPPGKQTDCLHTAIRIMQMDCPTEEALLRSRLGVLKTVQALEFNLMKRILTVHHTPDTLEDILESIRALGFEPEVVSTDIPSSPFSAQKKFPWKLAFAGIAAFFAEAGHWLSFPEWLNALFALTAILLCGLTTYKKGWIALRHASLNINALMSIAVTGAFILGQWPEAAMVMVLFTLAELIEARSLDRTRNAIGALLQLAPETATVKLNDGNWSEADVKNIELGCIIRVRPGERIALDGTIISGRSTLNQAPITGESLPVEKAEGDQVFAGTINEAGTFDYQVTATASNTTLARIIHAVEEAQSAKAPTQRFVDQFARVYTPIVFIFALAIALLPPLLTGGEWHEWIYKALVLLVIACPCALVISTPVTIVSGLTSAARHGILIKGGVYLEEGRKLAWILFDKTGTLTHGKPVQTDFEILTPEKERNHEIHLLAASLAAHSDHPVSKAILKAAQQNHIKTLEVKNFEALLGRGIRGDINGTTYFLGNHHLIETLNLCSPALEARLDRFERQGKTVVALMDETTVLSLFAVADTIKENSSQAITELRQLGIQTMILSGDNPHTVRAIAAQAGIDEARGNLLPSDKLEIVDHLEKQAAVGMVGDGINDAPALARARIGFAMGAMGTDTAIETADVALMDDDLQKLPIFIHLSRLTHAALIQNITLALGIKAVFLVLTLLGMGSMWMAVFADVGASLLVVANGLKLLRK